MTFKDYIENFTGLNKKSSHYPGEHHFVSMCLLPLLVKNIRVEEICNIHFINPDGTKVPNEGDGLICDITYGLLGLEVKYSETGSLTYTSKQLNSFFPYNKDTQEFESDPNFKGFIAIINVEKGKLKAAGCQVIHITAKNFIEHYGKNSVLKKAKANSKKSINISKVCCSKGKLLSGWVHIKTKAEYLALFGLGLK